MIEECDSLEKDFDKNKGTIEELKKISSLKTLTDKQFKFFEEKLIVLGKEMKISNKNFSILEAAQKRFVIVINTNYGRVGSAHYEKSGKSVLKLAAKLEARENLLAKFKDDINNIAKRVAPRKSA